MKKIILRMIFISIIMIANNIYAKTFIFVSHSMNDEALKAYFKEAIANDAILVMRGLVNNSFIDTKVKCEQLEISYEINPVLFDLFKIEIVPVIIQQDGEIIKKVTGHISLKDAFEIFHEEKK